jgi:hypothetical protein
MTKRAKLSAMMRRYARKAAVARLAGRMQSAQFWDDEVEKIYNLAKLMKLGEGFLVRAEEKGRQLGGRQHSRAGRGRTWKREAVPRGWREDTSHISFRGHGSHDRRAKRHLRRRRRR